jgi:cell division protease FtsH
MKPAQKDTFSDIIAQEHAVNAVRRWLERSDTVRRFTGVADVLAIAGPPASGKKLLMCETVRLLGRERLHLQMGEYAFADDINRLLGKEGILTEWIADHPEGCVVFEEVDACDRSIQRALSALVSEGAPGRPERYAQAVFIFIFKLSATEWTETAFLDRYYEEPLLEQAHLYASLASVASPDDNGVLRPLFDPELLNVLSLSDLVLLYPHDFDAMKTITEKLLQKSIGVWNTSHASTIEVHHASELSLALLLAFSPYLNSTRVAHRLPAYLFDLVSTKTPGKGMVTLDVGKDVRNWLRSAFSGDADIKSFGKYDRQFALFWERTEQDGGMTLRLHAIEERAQENTQNFLLKDRLFIHPIGPAGFETIAGQNRAKKQLESLLRLLRDEEGLRRFGITLPKGLLLYGPEGVGKSLLVKAFAKEAGLPYLYLHRSDLFDEELIEAAYQRARQAAPLLIILENVDIKGIVEGNLTPIPTETLGAAIDRCPDQPGNFVFTVMTAQNREEVPGALMHPGRIDQFVEVPELDKEARLFFAKQLLEKPHEKIDTERITRYMSGMNGFELSRIAKACALEAIKTGKEKLDESIIIDQINTIKYGSRLDRKRLKNFEEDLHRSAYHEAAHAIASLVLLPDVEIEQVTVIPRSETLGLVSYTQEEMKSNMNLSEIRGNIAVSLAGRLATIKEFGEAQGMETGAYSDLQQATMFAYSAVAQYGMDPSMMNVSVELLQQNISNTLFDRKVETCIAQWITEGTQTAGRVIEAHWSLIETVADRLIKEEYIEGGTLKALFKNVERSPL